MNTYKILPDGTSSGISFNDLQIIDMPGTNDFFRLNGKKGSEIYSAKLLNQQIEASYDITFCTDKQHILFVRKLISNKDNWNSKFIDILLRLSHGLTTMIYLLHRQPECFVKANCLEEGDRRFWKSCKNIILCANFLQGQIGRFVECKVNEYLSAVGIGTLKIECCFSDITPSLLGCSRATSLQNQTFLYDFGSTWIKRGFNHPNRRNVVELEPLPTSLDDFEDCNQLRDRMADIIINDIRRYGSMELMNIDVSLCIANNIINGKIHDRGKYGILCEFGNDYQAYFEEHLQKKLNKEVHVHMMNDAEAVAALYSHYAPVSAVITLGTAIGIGYPRRERIQ